MVDSGRIWKECHGWYGFLSKGLQSFEPDPTSHLMGPPFTIFQWFPVLCSGSDADLTAHVILASWCITHRFMRSSRKRPWFMDVYGLSMFILQLCLFGTLNLTRPKFTLAVDFSQSGNSMLVCLVKILCRLHTLPGLCTTLSWERESDIFKIDNYRYVIMYVYYTLPCSYEKVQELRQVSLVVTVKDRWPSCSLICLQNVWTLLMMVEFLPAQYMMSEF